MANGLLKRAACSRADLLRALAHAGNDAALQTRYAHFLEFYVKPPADEALAVNQRGGDSYRTGGGADQATAKPSAVATDRLRARLPVVTKRTTVARAQESSASAQMDGGLQGNLDNAAPPAGPWLPGHRPPPNPLVRAAQLWPALAKASRRPRDAGLDLRSLVQQISQCHVLQRLPRANRAVWGGELWVVLDRSPHLHPFAQDLAAVLRSLVRLRGPGGLVLWAVSGSPDAPLGPPAAGQGRSLPAAGRWPQPPTGTVVLLLSDLGALMPVGAASAPWQAFAQHLQHVGCHPVAWLPAAPAQVGQALAKSLPVHCLQPGAALKPQRGRWRTVEQQQAEQTRLQALMPLLQAMVACCVHLDPPLLRALRLAHPALRHEPALESLYWCDQTQVSPSLASRILQPQAAAQARASISQLPTEQLPHAARLAVAQVLFDQHADAPRSSLMLELSLWRTHVEHVGTVSPPAPALPAAVSAAVAAAQPWVQQLGRYAATLPSGDGKAARGMASYARDLLARQGADLGWQAANAHALAALWASTGDGQAPEGIAASALLLALRQRQKAPLRRWSLLQRCNSLWLWPAELSMPRNASLVADGLQGHALAIDRSNHPRQFTVLHGEGQSVTPWPVDDLPLSLSFESGVLRVDAVARPPWALEWGRDAGDAQGLYATVPTPWGRQTQLRAGLGMKGLRFDGATYRHSERCDFELGADEPHSPCGLYVDLTIQNTTQRLRHIPPGEFLMGSPDDEPERSDNEGPQHRVRLTQGLWLADTACTQALWLAVMGGKNPSHFSDDPNKPVEQVSWDDVQTFLQRLQPLLPPGCEAVLPTEAQWEYACRAGSTTSTPFSFGSQITPELVNYDGGYPYSNGKKGLDRGCTVPVKSLPPNDWGLYEMHGNVWEWCADGGQRDYDQVKKGQAVEDPTGPQEQGPKALRVFRGGSWALGAHFARSAIRIARERGDRGVNLGFRLALRSSSTSPGLLAPEAPQGLASGRDGPMPAARRDAGPLGGTKGPVAEVRSRLFGDKPKPKRGDK